FRSVVLEHMQALTEFRIDDRLVIAIGEPRRIAVREDCEDAGLPFRQCAVDPVNAASRDRAAHDGAVGQARHIELGGVGGGASDFLAPIDTADRLSDHSSAHARAPAVSTARTITRCMSSILKSLCPCPRAPSAASAAAARSAAG